MSLRNKRDSVRNDDRRDRVARWIEDEENAINDIRGKIEQLEDWICKEKDKLP